MRIAEQCWQHITCIIDGCPNPVENRETGLCASCGAAMRKAERQSKKVKIVSPVKKITQKRAAQTVEYTKLRREYLEAYPACEVEECNNKSKEIHHKKGREEELLTDVDNFMAVCPSCHHKITVDSEWAIEKGYSYKRTAK